MSKKSQQDNGKPVFVIDSRPEAVFKNDVLIALRKEHTLFKISPCSPSDKLDLPNVKLGIFRDPTLPNYSEISEKLKKASSPNQELPSNTSSSGKIKNCGKGGTSFASAETVILDAYERTKNLCKVLHTKLSSLEEEKKNTEETLQSKMDSLSNSISEERANMKINNLKLLLMCVAEQLNPNERWNVCIEKFCNGCEYEEPIKGLRDEMSMLYSKWLVVSREHPIRFPLDEYSISLATFLSSSDQ